MVSNTKIRIKDIAEYAGVSVGTVDRVIHNRGSVSQRSRVKVEKALSEMGYEPNHYASALATNKVYRFAAILPMHEKDSYWARVESGINKGLGKYRDFKIAFNIFSYDPFNDNTFIEAYHKLIESEPYAVIIAPVISKTVMTNFLNALKEKSIYFAFIDSNWPDFDPVCFYGQNSTQSGEFSARILLMSAGYTPKKICIFKVQGEGRIATQQQLDREKGFKDFVKRNSPDSEILELHLMAYDKEGMKQSMKNFFTTHKDIDCGITFNSTISLVALFLKENMPDYKIKLLGYDTVGKNVECLKQGYVDFIIAQHAEDQGLNCFRSLLKATVLNTPVRRDHYVAIELLTKENVDFYED